MTRAIGVPGVRVGGGAGVMVGGLLGRQKPTGEQDCGSGKKKDGKEGWGAVSHVTVL